MSKDNLPDHQHDHKPVINRLSRIEGHVGAIKRMVDEDVSCPDILVQIAAERSALNSVGRLILEDHLRNCMKDAIQDGDFEEAMNTLKVSLDRFVS